MARMSFEIDQASAVNLAEWRVKQLAADSRTPMLKRVALNAAINGGNIKEIIDEVYGMGFALSADRNNRLHQQMLAAGSIMEVRP